MKISTWFHLKSGMKSRENVLVLKRGKKVKGIEMSEAVRR